MKSHFFSVQHRINSKSFSAYSSGFPDLDPAALFTMAKRQNTKKKDNTEGAILSAPAEKKKEGKFTLSLLVATFAFANRLDPNQNQQNV